MEVNQLFFQQLTVLHMIWSRLKIILLFMRLFPILWVIEPLLGHRMLRVTFCHFIDVIAYVRSLLEVNQLFLPQMIIWLYYMCVCMYYMIEKKKYFLTT